MITQFEMGDSRTVLKLEGKLRDPWVEELWDACERLQLPPGQIRLDLSAVTFIDSAGVRLLESLLRRGMMIVACSGFVAEMINMKHG